MAVSADGEAWAVINASPDIRTQLAASPALHPSGPRTNPIRSVLLAPERAVALGEIGAAILAETDGETPFGEIVERLAAKYDAPAEQLAAAARRFLAALIERRMAEALP